MIPLYKTPEKYLQQLVDSIEAQTYGNWELCLSDGSGADSPLTDYLNRLEKSDDRIRVIRNDQALQIAENTNAAMKAATGDFIVFADHDDELTPDALFRCVKALNEDPDLRFCIPMKIRCPWTGTNSSSRISNRTSILIFCVQ